MSKKLQAAVTLSQAIALSASFFSDGINVKSLDNVGLIIETAGVTVGSGTFVVQVRSMKTDGRTSSQWVDLSITPPMAIANADASFAISLRDYPFSEVRVKFTAGSGSDNGTCNIWVEGKGGAV